MPHARTAKLQDGTSTKGLNPYFEKTREEFERLYDIMASYYFAYVIARGSPDLKQAERKEEIKLILQSGYMDYFKFEMFFV